MSSMFTGKYIHSVDKKGRVNVPSKFRKLLDEEVVLTISNTMKDALRVYTVEQFEEMIGKIYNSQNYDPGFQSFLTDMAEHTVTVSIDSQNRILIPQNLRDTYGFKGEVVLLGKFRHFEIWDEERLKQSYVDSNYSREEENRRLNEREKNGGVQS